ncbi:MAG: T9SS type A sorting domain-containing protein [Ignavibacteria bacterium]|nr:T9SS type A sorting domain-containing protein [Ignavibacteria bacterium]
MKKTVILLMVFLGISWFNCFPHGFGAHMAHLQKIIELNLPGSYLDLINNSQHPEYKSYFLLGSTFPDVQYANHFKPTLQKLYQNVRDSHFKVLGIECYPLNGLTYEINMSNIPDPTDGQYVFGFDTHNDGAALQFAEYLLTHSQEIHPNVFHIGTGTTQKNLQLAFALGYYAHLCEDIVCHNFLVPRVSATLNLGDLQLIRTQSSFAKDPNAQSEGIVEAIVDNLYGANDLVYQTLYNDIWYQIGQYEPSVPLVIVDGVPYDNSTYSGLMNPVFFFFLENLKDFLNAHPELRTNSTISNSGYAQLMSVFRFANRFYPASVGKPFQGNQRIDQALATWVKNHLNLKTGFAMADVLAGLNFDLFGLRQMFWDGYVYPKYILSKTTPQMASDARSLVSLMLSDMTEADNVANTNSDAVNLTDYNRLKTSQLFTNPHGLLDQLWSEYETLGARIYNEVGPTGSGQNWYTSWSPWHSQTMTWGVYSSLNNSLSSLYISKPDVAVYDSWFTIGGQKVSGPMQPSVFANNTTAQFNIQLFNTRSVGAQSYFVRIKKDDNSTSYASDATVTTAPTFSINQNPTNYGSTARYATSVTFPVSATDLTNNKGYYFELVDVASGKPCFTSNFEQYATNLSLTPNYYQLYDSYKKYPYSLGVNRNLVTVNLSPVAVDNFSLGGSYLVNGLPATSITGEQGSVVQITAVPPLNTDIMYTWTGGTVSTNPISYQLQTNTTIGAYYKRVASSNLPSTFQYNSQKKMVSTTDGTLYRVYESMERVWLERSFDNGVTWSLMNNNRPLSETASKGASIDATSGQIGVVFQENGYPSSQIRLMFIDADYTGTIRYNNVLQNGVAYYVDAAPCIRWNGTYGVVVWNGWYGGDTYFINYQIFAYPGAYYPVTLYTNSNFTCSGTNSMPCVGVANDGTTLYLQFAWANNNAGASHIMYRNAIATYPYNSINWNPVTNISSASGFTTNTNPSLIEIGNSARVVWVGTRVVDYEQAGDIVNKTNTAITERKVVFKDPGYYRYWSFGNNVNSPSIAKNSSAYAFAWTENDSYPYSLKFAYNNLSTITNIPGTWGKYVSTASVGYSYVTDLSNIYACNFSTAPTPYLLTSTAGFSTYMPAPKSLPSSFNSREAVLSYKNAECLIGYGDILIDGKPVAMSTLPENYTLNSLTDLEKAMSSDNFVIDGSGKVRFSVSQQTLGKFSGAAVNALISIVESSTQKRLAIINSTLLSGQSSASLHITPYEADLKNYIGKKVQIVLSIQGEAPLSSQISDKISAESFVANATPKVVNLESLNKPQNYSLLQNYPNPFNPTTTITYQLPKAGHTTLKIYDMLGRVVMTLVDGQSDAGTHSVVLNAAHLASGVYIYELRSGDFKASSKLMLMK